MIPAIIWVREPNITGAKCVLSAASSPNVSEPSSASAVQPTYTNRHM